MEVWQGKSADTPNFVLGGCLHCHVYPQPQPEAAAWHLLNITGMSPATDFCVRGQEKLVIKAAGSEAVSGAQVSNGTDVLGGPGQVT